MRRDLSTMSLKAKIEAVIYAAEEPVTLAQLSAIFAAEVSLAAAEQPQEPSLPFGGEVTQLDESGTMKDDVAAANDPSLLHLDSAAIDSPPGTAVDVFPTAEPGSPASTSANPREIRDHIRILVEELISEYVVQDRGIEIREIAGGYRMATKPEYHDAVRAFVKNQKPVMKLSPQALETLAVIAYKQPVTSPEIGEIRGVDSGGVLASLIGRKLVTTAGRKQVIGRPILYKTTKEFLMGFGLKDLGELPSMEEFEKIAGELAESDALEAEAMHEKAGVAFATENEPSQIFVTGYEVNQQSVTAIGSLSALSEQGPEEMLQERES